MMGKYFFDGSALSIRYAKGRGFEMVESVFKNKENEIFISNLTPVEMVEKLNKMKKEHVISEIEMRYELRLFYRDLQGSIFMIPYYDEHLDTSMNLVAKHSISTVSAIQLAIAIGIPAELVFVSTGKTLCEAAKEEGLEVLNPEG